MSIQNLPAFLIGLLLVVWFLYWHFWRLALAARWPERHMARLIETEPLRQCLAVLDALALPPEFEPWAPNSTKSAGSLKAQRASRRPVTVAEVERARERYASAAQYVLDALHRAERQIDDATRRYDETLSSLRTAAE